jgi:hypothetical protein
MTSCSWTLLDSLFTLVSEAKSSSFMKSCWAINSFYAVLDTSDCCLGTFLTGGCAAALSKISSIIKSVFSYLTFLAVGLFDFSSNPRKDVTSLTSVCGEFILRSERAGEEIEPGPDYFIFLNSSKKQTPPILLRDLGAYSGRLNSPRFIFGFLPIW